MTLTDLTKLTKKKLIALCEEYELDADGTKAELMDRLTLTRGPMEEVVEEPAAPVEMPKASARERVRIAWRKSQGGGHPQAMLWEEMTTELALGRKTEEEIQAIFADL